MKNEMMKQATFLALISLFIILLSSAVSAANNYNNAINSSENNITDNNYGRIELWNSSNNAINETEEMVQQRPACPLYKFRRRRRRGFGDRNRGKQGA